MDLKLLLAALTAEKTCSYQLRREIHECRVDVEKRPVVAVEGESPGLLFTEEISGEPIRFLFSKQAACGHEETVQIQTDAPFDTLSAVLDCYYRLQQWRTKLACNPDLDPAVDFYLLQDQVIYVSDMTMKLLFITPAEICGDEGYNQISRTGYYPKDKADRLKETALFERIHDGTQTVFQIGSKKRIILGISHEGLLVGMLAMEMKKGQDSVLYETLLRELAGSRFIRELFARSEMTERIRLKKLLEDRLQQRIGQEEFLSRIFFSPLPQKAEFLVIRRRCTQENQPRDHFSLPQEDHELRQRIIDFHYEGGGHYLLFGESQAQLVYLKRRLILESGTAACELLTSRPFISMAEFADRVCDCSLLNAIPLEQTTVQEGELSFADNFGNLLVALGKSRFGDFRSRFLEELAFEDDERQTNRFEILREYLYSGRDITKTARKLSYHRNTILYHIRQLEEKYSLDLADDRFYFNLLIQMKLQEQGT